VDKARGSWHVGQDHQDRRAMTETHFTPGPDTTLAFREALGCFGTGVTVVTTMSPQGPMAITVNSFTSVSLDPALVLWCPAKTSTRYAEFMGAQHYVIHVMAEDQHSVAKGFAMDGADFSVADWTQSQMGAPLLSGCLARFECSQHAVHDAGDHSIIVGQVDAAMHRPGRGLIFKRGQYGDFAPRG
jgi:flavin reductase (DIM6/NTAB) family NADH-FMN oxidoreductase RutF